MDELKKMEKIQPFYAREEKILVLVRLRPLSDIEIAANEVADWECINDTTILYRNSLREGSLFPSAYSFGKKMSFSNFYPKTLLFCPYIYTTASFCGNYNISFIC